MLSFKLQFSAANTSSHVWGDGRMEERRNGLRWFSPPLCLQNVSNYLHLPPTNLKKPSRAFLSSYPLRCKNYPNSTLSHLSCKPARLDDSHRLFFSRVSSPRSSSERKWELKKQEKRGERTSDWDVGKSDETWDVFHATTCHIFVYKR